MADKFLLKEILISRLKFLKLCLGNSRATINFYRFDGLPYDLEIALTHLIESIDSCSRLIYTHLDLLDGFSDDSEILLHNVHESDSDQES